MTAKNKRAKSKCCNASIIIGMVASVCDECGNSVDPDTGEPYTDDKGYTVNVMQFGGINI